MSSSSHLVLEERNGGEEADGHLDPDVTQDTGRRDRSSLLLRQAIERRCSVPAPLDTAMSQYFSGIQAMTYGGRPNQAGRSRASLTRLTSSSRTGVEAWIDRTARLCAGLRAARPPSAEVVLRRRAERNILDNDVFGHFRVST